MTVDTLHGCLPGHGGGGGGNTHCFYIIPLSFGNLGAYVYIRHRITRVILMTLFEYICYGSTTIIFVLILAGIDFRRQNLTSICHILTSKDDPHLLTS